MLSTFLDSPLNGLTLNQFNYFNYINHYSVLHANSPHFHLRKSLYFENIPRILVLYYAVYAEFHYAKYTCRNCSVYKKEPMSLMVSHLDVNVVCYAWPGYSLLWALFMGPLTSFPKQTNNKIKNRPTPSI